jgi:hypothetical protein
MHSAFLCSESWAKSVMFDLGGNFFQTLTKAIFRVTNNKVNKSEMAQLGF